MGSRIGALALCLVAGLGVSACAGDRGYGYTDVAVGVGGPVGDYWGWYGDYYYPGYGYYVYDRGGAQRRWSRDEHHYWGGRVHANPGYQRGGAPHWEGYTGGHAPSSFHGGGGHGRR